MERRGEKSDGRGRDFAKILPEFFDTNLEGKGGRRYAADTRRDPE
jgi:hypothetical protein